ncbi:hypothetical protein ABTZ03_31035 [Kitasatospora sp. NPDC096077]|uniref:hypothetical protein n=1 Tax=Kitasatospora sp. NPDC096077 TaxID=3155544 RepID=UPI003327097B
MSGRGRRASLPGPGESPACPPTLDDGGLVVRHRNAQGFVREYDFSLLPAAEPMRRSIARLFAVPCARSWTSHRTSDTHWRDLVAFAEYLAGLDRRPEDLDDLDARAVRQWWDGLKSTAGGRHRWQGVSAVLRHDERLQSGPVAEELARRVVEKRTGQPSYSAGEFRKVRAEARRTFRAALLRIEENAGNLERWREGAFTEGTVEWTLGEALEVIARTGFTPRTRCPGGRLTLPQRYRTALGGTSSLGTWMRLYLSRFEATALGVLLMADFGWNLSVIDRVPAPRAAPDTGEQDGRATYLITLEKRRRGAGRWFETESVTDLGAGSPGRLITEALAASRFARDLAERLVPGTDHLVAWRAYHTRAVSADRDRPQAVGPVRFGVDTRSATEWAQAVGLGGSPFQRGRRTVLAVERRERAQHSQATHDRVYVLPDPQVQEAAVPVIAAGAHEALAHAREAVGLGAELRGEADPGDRPTATADCHDAATGPAPRADGGCGASFLLCLGCRNARIHPGHHPRLARLYQALDNARTVLPAGVWSEGWGDAHTRLEDLRHQVGEPAWQHALAAATDGDRALIDHLLAGDLDP